MSKSIIRTFADWLSAATAAKKALLERAKAASTDPEAIQRREARQGVVAARNAQIAELQAAKQAALQRVDAERTAAEAAEAAARAAALKANEEAAASRATMDAAEKARLEALFAERVVRSKSGTVSDAGVRSSKTTRSRPQWCRSAHIQ